MVSFSPAMRTKIDFYSQFSWWEKIQNPIHFFSEVFFLQIGIIQP